jgi:hypothetical protein
MSHNRKTAPSHFAYVVEEYKSGKEIKSYWTKVGSVWKHDDGEGFTLRIRPGLAVSGPITVRPPLPEEAEGAQAEGHHENRPQPLEDSEIPY